MSDGLVEAGTCCIAECRVRTNLRELMLPSVTGSFVQVCPEHGAELGVPMRGPHWQGWAVHHAEQLAGWRLVLEYRPAGATVVLYPPQADADRPAGRSVSDRRASAAR